MPKNFARNLTSRHRNKKADMQLGVALAFIAGAVNAAGFLAAGYYTSHMTGMVSLIADAVGLYLWETALIAAAFLCSFLLGAFISCLIIQMARARNFSSEFAFALMLEAFLLLIFGLSASNSYAFSLSLGVTVCLLCFIMGLQNAIITKISNAEIRTTHVTGLVTDIGIEMGRYIFQRADGHLGEERNTYKLKVHAGLLLSFLTGGILGVMAYKAIGFGITIPLALLLALLASVPVLDDFKSRSA